MNDKFEYISSKNLPGVSCLRSKMVEFCYSKHAHEEYSIGVTKKGKQEFFTNGSYECCTPGNIMLFTPEQVHDGSSSDGQILEYDMLYIHPYTLEKMMDALGEKVSYRKKVKQSIFKDLELSNKIVKASSLIRDSKLSIIEEENLILDIANSMLRIQNIQENSNISRNRKDSILLKAQDYILSYFDKNISIDDICKEIGISKYHFIRLFNQHFGMTPHQFIINTRLNNVKSALHSNTPVNAVAFDFGFSDISHMNRFFKKAYGITPKQYQEQIISNNN
ncbi:AraC family transcriptional regulator [Psychromonas sp.]|uniref:AraC family transcriptional regulator n=1 Tax=Psychromonas sp. TaxID=1884585 RepID=UPI003A9879F8